MAKICQIRLPGHIGIRNVANAIGIMAGLPIHIQNDKSAVLGVTTNNLPSMLGAASIELAGTMLDGHKRATAMYYFEIGESNEREVTFVSTPIGCAIGKRLVQFFGGRVVFKTDLVREMDVTWDLEVSSLKSQVGAARGEDLRKLVMNLRALTPGEFEAGRAVADVARDSLGGFGKSFQ